MTETEHWMQKAGVLRASPTKRALGAVVCIAFGSVFLYFMLPEIWGNLGARGWTESSCTILSSAAGSQRPTEPDGERLYRVDVRYRYEVGGDAYESTRYRFVNAYVNDQAKVEAAVRDYPVGATVPCLVDPNDATEAVLDRRFSPFALAALVPAAFVLLGVWSLLWVGWDVARRRA